MSPLVFPQDRRLRRYPPFGLELILAVDFGIVTGVIRKMKLDQVFAGCCSNARQLLGFVGQRQPNLFANKHKRKKITVSDKFN